MIQIGRTNIIVLTVRHGQLWGHVATHYDVSTDDEITVCASELVSKKGDNMTMYYRCAKCKREGEFEEKPAKCTDPECGGTTFEKECDFCNDGDGACRDCIDGVCPDCDGDGCRCCDFSGFCKECDGTGDCATCKGEGWVPVEETDG